jgi:hypothetical protein
MYETFGPESDFESEFSWVSYPPKHGFIRHYWEHNPTKLGEDAVFKEKIKYKYQFDNCRKEVYPVLEPVPKVIKPSRKTQTFGLQTDPNFDPFATANEVSVTSESEVLSAYDKGLNLCNYVIGEGFSSDYNSRSEGRTNQRSSSKQDEIITKKRRRGERGSDIVTDSGEDRTEQEDGDVKLGTVFDKDGHVLYDKDYYSVKEESASVRMSSRTDMDVDRRSEYIEQSQQPG